MSLPQIRGTPLMAAEMAWRTKLHGGPFTFPCVVIMGIVLCLICPVLMLAHILGIIVHNYTATCVLRYRVCNNLITTRFVMKSEGVN